MLTVDVQSVYDGQTLMTRYEGRDAYRHAIEQAREWLKEGKSDVVIDGSRDMTMLEFATSFTIMYIDPDTGFEHHENRAIHLDFVNKQDSDRVWSIVPKPEGRGLDMVSGLLPSEHLYVVTEEPFIQGISVDHFPDPSMPNYKRQQHEYKNASSEVDVLANDQKPSRSLDF